MKFIPRHKAHPEYDEQRVRNAVAWNHRWGQRLGGLYFDEELAGPNGMNVQLLVTADTPDLIIEAGRQQAIEEGDVVNITALECPPEWLEGDPTT